MRLIHVSDLHIKALPRENKAVREKLHGALKLVGSTDKLVITGDITDDGLESQYAQALEMLLPFKGRIVMCPGNHDYGLLGSFFDVKSARRWYRLCEDLEVHDLTELKVDGFVVGQILALDTCLGHGSIIDFSQGRVGFWQRRELKKFLARTYKSRMVSIVIMHHTPFYAEWFCRLQDAKKFFDTVLGQADYVLMGHEHKEKRSHYPMKEPEERAITQFYCAGALFQDKTSPTIIHLHDAR